jgi:large subunit ribosomal protein L10
MLRRPEKEDIVRELKDNISKSQAVFLTNLVGLPSNDGVALRKKVRDANGFIMVTRNTLFRRAGEGTACEQMLAKLKGPQALAFAYGDAAAVAKALNDASTATEGLVKLEAAVLDGKLLTAKDLKMLANLPSKPQMLGTLLATMNAPISALARALEAVRAKKETEVVA